MGRLAIVIPSIGHVEALESTLVSVLENRPRQCEVLVVHTHPYDDPYNLQGEVRFLRAPARSSYVSCANLGIRESSADVVHVLAPSCRVSDGWTDGVWRHFQDPRVAVVAPVIVHATERHRAIAANLSYGVGGMRRSTPRLVDEVQQAGVAPMLAASLTAVFYNRVTLGTVGYLSEDVGADLADIDLGLLLRHAGFASLCDPRSRVFAPEQPLEIAGSFRRGLWAERLFWRNLPLVGWLRGLAAHPLTVAATTAGDFPRPSFASKLAGRLVGSSMLSSHRRHHQRISDLKRTAPVLAGDSVVGLRIDRPHGGPQVRRATDAAHVR